MLYTTEKFLLVTKTNGGGGGGTQTSESANVKVHTTEHGK